MLLIEKTYYHDSDCGMNLAWTMTMVMKWPLTLTLAGAMILAELRAMALIIDSDCIHGQRHSIYLGPALGSRYPKGSACTFVS